MPFAALKPVLIAATVLVVIGVMVQSCVGGPPNVTLAEPTEKLTTWLEPYESASDSAATAVAKEVPNAIREQLGIGKEELGKAMLEGFEASIDNIEFNDNKSTATATVTLRSKDMSQVEALITEVANELPKHFDDTSSDEATDWADQQVLKKISELPIVTHDPIIFEVRRTISRWDVVPPDHNGFMSALCETTNDTE